MITDPGKLTTNSSTMIMNNLGQTGLKLSKLGLGTVKLGRNTKVKYPSSFNLPTLPEITKLLDLAINLGINTLDTAPAYGDSEVKLGKIFSEHTNSISRENLVIITKAGEEFHNNISSYNFSPNHINTSLDNSLRRLKTDYLDIFLIHSDGSDKDIAGNEELWQVLSKRKQQGDIRAYGVSSKTVAGGLACLKQSDLAMVTYRQDYQDEKALLDYAKIHNKGIILKKVLNSGNHDGSIEQCIKFSGEHPAVTSMIVGTINSHHLCDLARSFDINI